MIYLEQRYPQTDVRGKIDNKIDDKKRLGSEKDNAKGKFCSPLLLSGHGHNSEKVTCFIKS